ncbi:MAG: 1-acyl-sn-glycerol-3-phosphate acyltransferase [Leptospiraceae bacterium]|nr:1-acyl-sn-glycerol-3-phosphate acyltransferase [Leptospiraceae bacterium]
MQPFIAPSHSLPLNWTVDFLFPVLLKIVQNIEDVVIDPEDVRMLRTLRKDRMLFFTNHPTTAEPPIAHYIGKLMGVRFKYMASRQVFDWNGGMVGKVISNLGAFSVIAGINDRESFKAARGALAQPEGKLVLFPEGEPTSGENDSLMPFQGGVAQLSFWAMDDARKVDPEADITILPAFIKYVIKATEAESRSHLMESAARIERKLGIDPGDKNLLRRFLTIGRVLLEQAEAEYKVPPASKSDFDYRIGRVRHAILDQVAERLELKNFDYKADAIMKLRQLFAVHEMLSIGYPDEKLKPMTKDEIDWVHRQLVTAFDFIVIKKDYLVSRPTPERFYEWLARIESYVYGKTPRALGGEPSPVPRKAYVRFAKPFKLSEYWSTDKRARKSGVEKMMKRLDKDIQGLLNECLDLSQPIVKPYDVGADPA